MNQTEAWELVVRAAESRLFIADIEAQQDAHAFPKPATALKKIKPRVERMRSRLDFARARRAGKPRCPKGLEP